MRRNFRSLWGHVLPAVMIMLSAGLPFAQEGEESEEPTADITLPEIYIEKPRTEHVDVEKPTKIPGRVEASEIDTYEQKGPPLETIPEDLGDSMMLPESEEPPAAAGPRYRTSGSAMIGAGPDYAASVQHGDEFKRYFYKISAKGHNYEENIRGEKHSGDRRVESNGTLGLKLTENADISLQTYEAAGDHELPFGDQGSICNADLDLSLMLRQKRPGGDHSLIQLYYRSIDLNYADLDLSYNTAYGTGGDPRIDEAGMALRWSMDLAENNVLRIGGEVYQDKVDEEGIENFERTVVLVYLADRWKLDWRWPVVLRLKALYNEDDEHDGEGGAQLRVSTSPADNWSLHLAGKFQQNIYSYVKLYRDARYFLINRHLKPEVEARGEVGGTYTRPGVFTSGLTVFYRVIDDYTVWHEVEKTNLLWAPCNLGADVTLIGCEASIGFETTRFLEHQLRYTFTHSDADHDVQEVVPFTPEHVGVYDLEARTDFGLKAELRGAYTSRRYFTALKDGPDDCGYFTLDIKVSQEIGDYCTVFVLGKNLTDDKHEERTAYKARGARVFAGAEFRF